jgi:quercetin dioxygenase-like cupin family protein
MRRHWQSALAVTCVAIAGWTCAQVIPLNALVVTPDEPKWTPNPAGFEVARVVGDPTKPNTYVNRVKFPAGLKVQPHFHPDERVGTVLSGTFYFGYGERFDESKMHRLPAGSVWTEPAKQPHFAWAKDGEVIIQVGGVGPSGTTPVIEGAK